MNQTDDDRPELVARVARVTDVGDPPVLVAALAEAEDGSGFGLMFQLASVFDEQDRKLGMDTYCICTSDGATHYGGVVRIRQTPQGIQIDITDSAARRLSAPSRFHVRMAVPPTARAEFWDALRRVVGEHD